MSDFSFMKTSITTAKAYTAYRVQVMVREYDKKWYSYSETV